MIKKGIILAGGMGTRMSPLTKAVNKQLLPIYDKPLIFYPLSILMLAGIKKILIIVNKGQLNQFKKIIPNGNNLGVEITYKEQSSPITLATRCCLLRFLLLLILCAGVFLFVFRSRRRLRREARRAL